MKFSFHSHHTCTDKNQKHTKDDKCNKDNNNSKTGEPTVTSDSSREELFRRRWCCMLLLLLALNLLLLAVAAASGGEAAVTANNNRCITISSSYRRQHQRQRSSCFGCRCSQQHLNNNVSAECFSSALFWLLTNLTYSLLPLQKTVVDAMLTAAATGSNISVTKHVLLLGVSAAAACQQCKCWMFIDSVLF